MEYVANLSCGKDSLAMVLRLLEEKKPLTKCVMFDTGMEYKAIYNNLEKIKKVLIDSDVELIVLRPKLDFLTEMLLKQVNGKNGNVHYGYEWCGGNCRWRTTSKVQTIQKYLNTVGEYVQYIGIAIDEPQRIKKEKNKIYPLVDWGMTEKDCLNYCYAHGWDWKENGIELYSVLDRVSCWCCGNKNLKELKNMYKYLPFYWTLLKGLQSRIDRPFRSDGKTIFDLEKRFEEEEIVDVGQQELF